MLGRALRDPDGVESAERFARGLDLLPVETTFAAPKTTLRVRARPLATAGFLAAAAAVVADAYEIHAGVTRTLDAAAAPLFALVERGGVAVDVGEGARVGAVAGTSLHGLFAAGPLRRALLAALAARAGRSPRAEWGTASPLGRWDRLADVVAGAVDVKAVGALVGRPL
jgi:adenosylcobyric acid synthase